ncbi:MAG: ABC transporter substrate-binding protein [Lachnospiraceae bacterium]|nr:ABC transporter substrate-binding protein [Lachnospiraceae bacterium]
MIAIMLALCTGLAFCACGAKEKEVVEKETALTTVGFSQIGAESDWRLASTSSMQASFNATMGYRLVYDDGQQKQENQLKAMREFIDSEVDYIVLDPITELGWDATLMEAKEAGIPVILVDRQVSVEDDSVYTAWVGSDFLLEGQRACAWLEAYLSSISYEGEVNIAHIQGTTGSSAQIGRSDALEEAAEQMGWNIVAQEDADFVQAKGREVMESMLEECGDLINVVYCENDSEALGAIEAIENYGKTPGSNIAEGEIMVISFDATEDGLRQTLAGKIALDTECNPNYGTVAEKLISSLKKGEIVPHEYYMEESQFSGLSEVNTITVDGKTYDVTMVTDAIIAGRNY